MSTIVAPLSTDSTSFFKLLFNNAQGTIVFCCKAGHSFKRVGMVVIGSDGWVDRANEIAAKTTDCYLKFNVFDGNAIKARSRNAIGARGELTEVVCFAVDVDVSAKDSKYATQADALAALQSLPVPPSLIVGSNGYDGGLHAYWLLDEPVVGEAIEDAQAIAKRWYEGLNEIIHVDATFALERILRPVGSVRANGNSVVLIGGTMAKHTLADLTLPGWEEHVEPEDSRTPSNGEETESDRIVKEALGLADVGDVLRHFNWDDLGNGFWLRPEGTSGSKSGEVYVCDDGRVGFTIKTPTIHARVPDIDVKLPRIDWYGPGRLWVLLEHGELHLTSYIAEKALLPPGWDFPDDLDAEDPRIDKIELPPVKRSQGTTKEKDRLLELRNAVATAESGEAATQAEIRYCLFLIETGIRVDPLPGFWGQAVKIYQTTQFKALTSKKPASNKNIPVDGGWTVQKVNDRITDLLKATKRCFQYSGIPGYIQKTGDFNTFDSSARLGSYLTDLGVKFISKKPIPLPRAYGEVWLCSEDRLPVIETFTRTPAFDADWRLLPVGYDERYRTYYQGEAIAPVGPVDVLALDEEGNAGLASRYEALEGLLDCFCFKDDGQKANFIAILLSSLLVHHSADDGRPGVIVSGNQPSIGKTLLCKCAALLISGGDEVVTLGIGEREDELEKQLATGILNGDRAFIFDNVRGKIESRVIEKCMTDQTVAFRRLGGNQRIKAKNDFLWMFSANSPTVGEDIFARCLVVELLLEDDPRTVVHKIQPMEYVREKREAILGELVHMVKSWVAAGAVPVTSKFRFKRWAAMVGGILQVAGFTGFMDNLDEAYEAMSTVSGERKELAEQCIKAMMPGEFYSAKDVLKLPGVVVLDGGTERARATAIGIALAHNDGLIAHGKRLERFDKKQAKDADGKTVNRDNVAYRVVDALAIYQGDEVQVG